jgi:hypothetical protein
VLLANECLPLFLSISLSTQSGDLWIHPRKSVGWLQAVRRRAKKLSICGSYRDLPMPLTSQPALCESSAKGLSHLVSLIYDYYCLNRRAVTAQAIKRLATG